MAKKIFDHDLKRLAGQGKGVTAIARELNVTKGAISKRLKALNVVVARGMTLYRPAEKTRLFNMVDQFIFINEQANTLLNKLAKACDKVESLPSEVKLKDPRELLIKIVGEIKSQIGLWNELEENEI